jgi:lipopolysaccharide export system protein LptA
MNRIAVAVIAALGLSSAGGLVAWAQSRPSVSDQPIMIGADNRVVVTPEAFELSGRVEIMQGDNRLRADRLRGESSGGEVTRVTVSGDVYYVTPSETIRGDQAVYTTATGVIVITGDVVLTQGRNVLTGSRLTYNVDTGSAEMEGAPRGAAGNRVQGVFYPNGG